jgi:site-specific DNA recombinase
MVVDPETGRRVSRPNAAAEWQTSDAHELRLIDDNLWAAAQSLKAAKARLRSHSKRRPAHLLSGLLRCGSCGSGMSVHDRDKTGRTRIRCSAVRESGVCANRQILHVADVEQAVVDGMREQLRDPSLIALYVKAYNTERRQLASRTIAQRSALEARVAAAEREYDRVFAGYVKGFIPEIEAEKQLPALRREKEEMASALATFEEPPQVISLHPKAVEDYLNQIEHLAETLRAHRQAGDDAPATAMRRLIESVTLHVNGPRKGFEVEVKGKLAELVGGDLFPTGRFSGIRMVAEEGLEPPTRGL